MFSRRFEPNSWIGYHSSFSIFTILVCPDSATKGSLMKCLKNRLNYL